MKVNCNHMPGWSLLALGLVVLQEGTGGLGRDSLAITPQHGQSWPLVQPEATAGTCSSTEQWLLRCEVNYTAESPRISYCQRQS